MNASRHEEYFLFSHYLNARNANRQVLVQNMTSHLPLASDVLDLSCTAKHMEHIFRVEERKKTVILKKMTALQKHFPRALE